MSRGLGDVYKRQLVDIAEEEIIDFETEVMMVPQFDLEHPQMISPVSYTHLTLPTICSV